MSKRQLIDDIRRYNSTAQTRFLAQFEESALQQYLEHLESARQKHIRFVSPAVFPGEKVRMVS
jgi:hypothetical protein